MGDSVESLGNVKKHYTYKLFCVEGLIPLGQGSGEEFGLSGRGGIQTGG